MADVLRIKRRASPGAAGAPASLANAELAYNENDHTLYIGEGTGGGGGSATVVVPIGGRGLGGNANPLPDGTAAPGVANVYSREDHVHPSDTSRAPINSPVFTGDPQAPTQPNTDNDTSIATTAHVKLVRLDQFAMPNNPVSFNSQKIVGLAEPTNAQDAATKNYVDSVAQGIDPKPSVKAASTGNLTLSGTQTVDGVALAVNDRVLVKDQTTNSQNGIYVVQSGAWTRALDSDTWNELISAYTFVEQGTTNSDTGWTCTVDSGGTIGTTAVTWVQFSGAGSINAGAGLTQTGNTLNVGGTANRITINADSIDIASNYAGQASITTLGTIVTGVWNGTTIAVANGGTGVATLAAGYVKSNGTNPFASVPTIPNTDITGLGTMSTQNANAVAITGGTIDGITFDMGTF